MTSQKGFPQFEKEQSDSENSLLQVTGINVLCAKCALLSVEISTNSFTILSNAVNFRCQVAWGVFRANQKAALEAVFDVNK